MKQMPSGLTDLEGSVDVTDEAYEAEIIVTSANGMLEYSPDYVQLSIIDDNPVGKRFEGNRLIIDQGAPAGTITIKAVLPDNFYTEHTITVVNSGTGNPQPSQPKISHTLLDTSDLNHLIISATALDEGINKVQIRTFYKNASGMLPGDIVNLVRESDNSSVFSVDITDQVASKMRDSNAYEMIYFFTMLDGDGGFLQYPEVIDMDSLEGALTVKLADAPDNGSGDPELDKADLIAKINEAKDLYAFSVVGNGFGEYPGEVMDAFNTAIEAASRVKDTATTQAQIDAAYQDLADSITSFKADAIKGASKSDLRAKYDEARILYWETSTGERVGDYPPQAKAALMTALVSVEGVLNNPAPPQDEIDDAYQRVYYAIQEYHAAQIKAGNPAPLQVKINEAQLLWEDADVGTSIGQYPAEAKDALEAAIFAANEGLNNAATEAELDAAYQALNTAITTFKDTKIKRGDTTALEGKIHDAWILTVTKEEGNASGQYPSSAFNDLRSAITAAEHWVIDPVNNPGTQAEINEAYEALVNAIQSFLDSQNTGPNKQALQSAIEAAKSFVNNSVEGTKVGQYPEGSKAILQGTIDAAWNTLINLSSTQTEVDQALNNLTAALEDFELLRIEPGDSTLLQDKIHDAKDLLQNSVVGDHVGEYPSEAFDALKQAIADAETLIDSSGTQQQIDAAYQAIVQAINAFEDAQIQEGNYMPLLTAISEATALYNTSPEGNGAGQYWPEVKALFMTAIEAATVVAGGPSTQVEISQAMQVLANAVEEFKNSAVPEGDSTKLQAAIAELTTLLSSVSEGDDAGEYPAGSKALLQAAVTAAANVISTPATQEEIDHAYEVLEDAADLFVAGIIPTGDNSKALEKIQEIGQLLEVSEAGNGVGQYPAEAMAALQAAFDAAVLVLDKPSSQVKIDATYQALVDAADVFEKAQIQAGDSEEAGVVVSEAGTLLKDSVAGEGVGQYPAEAVAALEAAVAAAKEVFDHPATQAQIDAAKTTLEAAITTFKAAVIKAGDSGEVQTKINAATTLLNESTEGSGVGQYPAGSKAILQAAITAAEEVIRTAATQAEIDLANEKLTAAYNAFLASVIKKTDDSYTPPSTAPTTPTVAQPSATQPVAQPLTKITDGLSTVETGQGTVKAAASEVQAIMKAAKPVILESTLAVIDFGRNGLNVPELRQGLDASLELGALLTEKATNDKVLAGAKLVQAGLQPLGGKVLDLIAQLNYSNGTSTRIKSFAEPVKVTVNLKELGLTGDTTNLTAVRFVPQADGTYKTIKLGGVYLPEKNSFEFYTDSFSLYSIVKADSITKITFKIDSKAYSIGALDKVNDVPPVIREQRTLVPVRAVAEALGAEVKWDHATKTATIMLDGKVLTMTLGELIEGMDVPAQAIDGRIMVPLRYVSETLGAYVMWFPQDKRIEIIR